MNPDLTEAQRLLEAGLKLIKLKHNTKQPEGERWNKNPATRIDPDATGYGFLLADNGLCSVDPDNVEPAREGLVALGFDLEAIMLAGVRTVSTRPGSGGRSTFTDPGTLRRITFATEQHGTILELRAQAANLQDVVPGLIYLGRDGRDLYTQRYFNGKQLDDAGPLPAELLAWWQQASSDLTFLREQQALFYEALGVEGYLAISSGTQLAFPSDMRGPFNGVTPVEDILERHGYAQHGERWSAPNASGSPGIRAIPGRDGLWQSDHASDPLQGTFDAWSACVVLDHAGDVKQAEAQFRAEQPEVALTMAESLRRSAARSSQLARERLARKAAKAPAALPAPAADASTATLAEPVIGSPAWHAKHKALALMPSDFMEAPPKIPQPIIEDWLPRQVVTLFGAHGGVGKSFVAMEVAVRVALGLRALGSGTQQVPVLFYSCEDSEAVMRRRADRLAQHLGHKPEDLDGKLFLFDMTCQPEVELFGYGKEGAQATALSAQLHHTMLLHGCGLLIVDNVSDVFGASEIARAEVRAFMRDQSRNARQGDYAVLLLAHTNKITASTKAGEDVQGYSGSTAWHNSARSRWYMAPVAEDRDSRELSLEKSNYGRSGLIIVVRWQEAHGLLLIGEQLQRRESLDNMTGAILTQLVEYEGKGIDLSTALSSPASAQLALRRDLPQLRGHRGKPVQELLEKLYRDGYLGKGGRPTKNSKGKGTVELFLVTEKGREAVAQSARMRAKITGTALPESSNRELLTGEYLKGDGPEADVRRYVESRLLAHRRTRKPLTIRADELQQLAEQHGLDFTRLMAQLADNYGLVQRGDVFALDDAAAASEGAVEQASAQPGEAVEPMNDREWMSGEWRNDVTPRGLLIRYLQFTAALAAQGGKPWELREEALRAQCAGLSWEGVVAMMREEYGMTLADGVFRRAQKRRGRAGVRGNSAARP